MAAITSLRALALETGYALATVSRALRDDPAIREETRRRIQDAAAKAGYRPNARIATAMRQIRRPGAKRSFDALAWLEWPYPAGHHVREDYLRTMWTAAERRAAKLGWALERFSLSDPRMPRRSLGRILHSRGIHAAVLPPLHRKMESLDVDFSRLPRSRSGIRWRTRPCAGWGGR
jgi:LacI family transcriptional regulator